MYILFFPYDDLKIVTKLCELCLQHYTSQAILEFNQVICPSLCDTSATPVLILIISVYT